MSIIKITERIANVNPAKIELVYELMALVVNII